MIYEPTNVSPVIGKLFKITNRKRMSLSDLARKSGVSFNTICSWRISNNPTLANFEATLNALGYELEVCRREK